MLAKQGWRIVMNPNNLMAKVLKCKYFRNSSFMDAKLGNNPSWCWRSILEGRQILKAGMRWRIGRGTSVKIFEDPWIAKHWSFKPRRRQEECNVQFVRQLIDENDYSWKENMIRRLVVAEDVDLILKIPLPVSEIEDCWTWHFSANGNYNVASGYEVATELIRNGLLLHREGGESSNGIEMEKVWRGIWEVETVGKIKHFIWKCCHDILPVKANLCKRKMQVVSCCPLCLDQTETVLHLFTKCAFSQKVWYLSPLRLSLEDGQYVSFLDWWETTVMRWVGLKEGGWCISLMVFTLWQLWKCRNMALFEHIRLDPRQVSAQALENALRYQEAYNPASVQTDKSAREVAGIQYWCRPDDEVVKINFDGAVGKEAGGLGIAARDSQGKLIWVHGKHLVVGLSPIMVEALAARDGLLLAMKKQMSRIILEGDCQSLINMILRKQPAAQEIAVIVQDIWRLCSALREVQFQFVRRESNEVAHVIARKAAMGEEVKIESASIPCWLSHPLAKDGCPVSL